MKIRHTYSLVFAMLYCLQTHAQSAETLQRIEQVENNLMTKKQYKDSTLKRYNIYDRMKHYKVPSVSVAVIYKGKTEWVKAYGLADVEENKSATTGTQYQAASLSKSVNALCVMKLVEQNKLSLDKDIRDYLKTWQIPENKYSRGQKITLVQLLSHTAGFNVHGFDGYRPGTPLPTTNEILNGKKPANNKAVKLILKPGTKFMYSGGGSMVVLNKIISDNISPDYESLIQKTVLQPLGILPEQEWPDLASAYEGTKRVPGKYNIYPAPAGLWTTPTDLAKFVLAIQHSLNSSNGFLNDSLAKRMVTVPANAGEYALGMGIFDLNVEKYFAHSGGNLGFKTYYCCSFSGDVGVVIMTNCEESKFVDELFNSIISVYRWKGITGYAGI